ncbi:hypothetical protein I3760_13G158100 [Carya illinoinensis]|nr:hypothetical protein I3760_13G158100 [Carya illinoinensis]KAG2674875.1 hypothetical protein I3760_13G158100 [Carya illinoinensis]
MTKKGLAKKEDKKESRSTTRKATSGTNKSKDASVDNEMRTGSLRDEVMRKVVGSSKGEESAVKNGSKSKDDTLDDDLKIGALKNEMLRKSAVNKPKTQKSGAKEVRKSNDFTIDADPTLEVLKTEVGGKVAGDKYMGKKVAKQSSKLEGSGADNDLKLGALEDEVTEAVSGGKSMGEKSAARKTKARGGAKIVDEEQDAKTNMMKEAGKEDTPTPMKRKRGADGEMAQAFWLSIERSSSRLRPRKEVPAFRLVDLEDDDNDRIVGKRVKVYWSGSRKWFTGHIKAFDSDKGLHDILYEDGDCEILDLRKERFELEVVATDCFKVRTKASSEKKVKGLDGAKVSAATLKEEMVDAEKEAKELEPEKKTPAEILVKENKDHDVSNEGDLIAEMGVQMLPEKAKEVVINEVVEEPHHAGYEKEQDRSKMDEEATQVIGLVSNSQAKELGSGNVEGSAEAVEVDFIEVDSDKSVKKRVNSKKRLGPGAVKRRSSRSQNRKESKEEEDQDKNKGGVSHDDEIKDQIMHVDVNVVKSVEVNYKDVGKIDSLAEAVHEGGIPAEGQHNTPDSKVEEKEMDQAEKQSETGDVMVPKDAINRLGLSSNAQGGKDDMEDSAVSTEASVRLDEVKEKVSIRKINVEGPGDVDTGKAKKAEDDNNPESIAQYVRRERSLVQTE